MSLLGTERGEHVLCGLLGLLGIAGSWVETLSLWSRLWEAGVSLTSVPL